VIGEPLKALAFERCQPTDAPTLDDAKAAVGLVCERDGGQRGRDLDLGRAKVGALASLGNDRAAGDEVLGLEVPARPTGRRQASRYFDANAATSSSALRSGSGSALPRREALRRIPSAARALKKYRCGRAPVSKMADNEDAAALLGDSEKLSVQYSVGEPIPELAQRSEDGAKVPSAIAREDSGDVLPDDEPRPTPSSKSEKFEGQVTAIVFESSA
jgi:hypothetical protein